MKIQLRSDVNTFEMDEGDVLVRIPTNLSAFDDAIDNLREALAKTIVERGEYVLRKEAMLMQAYGYPGRTLKMKDVVIEFKLDEAGVESLQQLKESFMTVQQALAGARKIAEVVAEEKAKREGLELLKAILIEQLDAYQAWDACGGVPDIDLDGQPLD